MDLVVDLRLHRHRVDGAAGAGQLGDRHRAVLDVGDREAEVVRVGHDAERRVLVVAAGRVHAALEQVADQRRVAHPVPVVELPAELVADRADEQRRVRQPAAEHDLRVLAQAVDDAVGAEVGVGRDHPVPQRADRGAELGELRVERGDQLPDVVAVDDADPDAGQADLLQRAGEVVARRVAVGGAEVADHLAARGEVARAAAGPARRSGGPARPTGRPAGAPARAPSSARPGSRSRGSDARPLSAIAATESSRSSAYADPEARVSTLSRPRWRARDSCPPRAGPRPPGPSGTVSLFT